MTRSQHVGPLGRRTGIDEPDHRHRLLRARREGPSRSSAEQRDEVAAS